MQQGIRKANDVLKKGGLILYPTDTVWGIGCDATNEKAVQRIYKLKRRDDSKPMLVLMDDPAWIQAYVHHVPFIAWDLIRLTDKPLTIIYEGAKNLAPSLIAPDGSIGIRITSESFSMELCRQFRKPIVATSANISGEPAPGSFSQIGEAILNGVDYIAAYGQKEQNKPQPSGIVRIGKDGSIEVIRK